MLEYKFTCKKHLFHIIFLTKRDYDEKEQNKLCWHKLLAKNERLQERKSLSVYVLDIIREWQEIKSLNFLSDKNKFCRHKFTCEK